MPSKKPTVQFHDENDCPKSDRPITTSHKSSTPKKLKRGYATFDLPYSQMKQYRHYHGVSAPSTKRSQSKR